jgi:hypothetical protein
MLRRMLRKLKRGVKSIATGATAGTRGYGAREYAVALPAGYPAERIAVRLSVPRLPSGTTYYFTDHQLDDDGEPTDTVFACATGEFAVSRDLGNSWKRFPLKGRRDQPIIHLKPIGGSRLLAQTARDATERKPTVLDVLLIDEEGRVLAESPQQGCRWHGCRSVAVARNTLMYAEYPLNLPQDGRRLESSRVFRSRDGGQTWHVAFERTGDQVRHFHFLQPRPGVPGEWWLTSGDFGRESRVWLTQDDGDNWQDLTESFTGSVDIGGAEYPRGVFRLTDLIWNRDEIVWGTDDTLGSRREPRAAVFRSAIGPQLKPELVGHCRWHLRNVVDVGEFYLLTSQGNPHPGNSAGTDRPAVYLMPKVPVPDAPGLVHLFDIECFSDKVTRFTGSRASRAAKRGTFFSSRARFDVFPAGNRILRWDVSFS